MCDGCTEVMMSSRWTAALYHIWACQYIGIAIHGCIVNFKQVHFSCCKVFSWLECPVAIPTSFCLVYFSRAPLCGFCLKGIDSWLPALTVMLGIIMCVSSFRIVRFVGHVFRRNNLHLWRASFGAAKIRYKLFNIFPGEEIMWGPYPRTQACSPQRLSIAVPALVLQVTNTGVRGPGYAWVRVTNTGVRGPGYAWVRVTNTGVRGPGYAWVRVTNTGVRGPGYAWVRG